MPYDAIVIGAGMSGLAAALRLAQHDQRVVVLVNGHAKDALGPCQIGVAVNIRSGLGRCSNRPLKVLADCVHCVMLR